MRLAILLLCHKSAEQINMFLETLQHPDIEFFVHVDAKSHILEQLISRSDIHILPKTLRVNVRWSEFSQVQATLNLMQMAREENKFDYYWLCSGQDFPIRSAKEIIKFLDKNNGANYLRFRCSLNNGAGQENDLDKRNIIFYPHWMYARKNLLRRISKRLYIDITGGYNHTYAIFRRKDKFSNIKAYFGDQWICITKTFLDWCFKYLKDNTWYKKHFYNAMIPDECFFHTLFMMSPFRDSLHDYLHYIDWNGCKNSPRILDSNDYDKLKESKFLMARKFDITVDRKILEMLMTPEHL